MMLGSSIFLASGAAMNWPSDQVADVLYEALLVAEALPVEVDLLQSPVERDEGQLAFELEVAVDVREALEESLLVLGRVGGSSDPRRR